ncbi:MAG: helix-turn-helix domain-containing protein [Myxococcota bacterium]
MTQGFYEQLGVPADADADALRDAYHRQVARMAKRTRQLREQGGDTTQLELARAQLDEAWAVLSMPARRQRYDAMVTFLEGEANPGLDAGALWASVADALVPPSVSAAAAILSRATKLQVPPVGKAPVVEARRAPRPAAFADESTSPTLAPPTLATENTEGPVPVPTAAPVISVPRPRPVVKLAPPPSEPKHDLKVVEGSPRASSVIVLPPDAPRQKTLTGDEVARLTDIHGYSGGLLRAVREAKGITLQEVADSTRISVRYLEAIEGDAHDRLPSATFVKGYVREVSRLLKLDEESVVTGYMRRLS